LGSNRTGDERGVWERLDLPFKVIGAAVAILGGLIGAYIAINPFGDSPEDLAARTSPSAVAAHQVARCMRIHGMRTPRTQVVSGEPGVLRKRVFRRCEWPSPVTTSADGYTEVGETTAYLRRANADLFNEVHTLRAPCTRLRISFVINHMSGRTFRDTTLTEGRVMLATTEGSGRRYPGLSVRVLDSVPAGVDVPAPKPGVFHVLQTGHIELLDAQCRPQGAQAG
jgi:hypothetical protein